MLKSLGSDGSYANKALAKLASLGTFGRNEQNIKREIETTFIKHQLGHLIRKLEDSVVCNFTVPPHLLFAELYAKYPNKFRIHLGADSDKLHEWWDNFRRTQEGQLFFAVRPDLRDADFRHLLPLSLHFDAGPISKTTSAEIATWGRAVGYALGNDFESRYCCGVWVKTKHNEQDNRFWESLFDSLDLLESGLDENGQLLAGGWKGTVVDLKDDLEEACAQFGFQSYSGEEMCGYCRANRTDLPFNHFSRDALWVPTVLWVQRCSWSFGRAPLA